MVQYSSLNKLFIVILNQLIKFKFSLSIKTKCCFFLFLRMPIALHIKCIFSLYKHNIYLSVIFIIPYNDPANDCIHLLLKMKKFQCHHQLYFQKLLRLFQQDQVVFLLNYKFINYLEISKWLVLRFIKIFKFQIILVIGT